MNTDAVAGCFARGGPPHPAFVLVPAAMFVVKTYGTAFLGVEPAKSIAGPGQSQSLVAGQHALIRRPDPAQVLAANAHVFLQRLIGRLPDALLSWFFSRVLNLSAETTETTVQFLKTQAAAGLAPSPSAPVLQAAAPESIAQEPTATVLALPEPPRHPQIEQAAMMQPSAPIALPPHQQSQPMMLENANDFTTAPRDTLDQQAALAEKLMSFAGELMIMANESTAKAPKERREASRRSKAPKGRRGAGQNRAASRAGGR